MEYIYFKTKGNCSWILKWISCLCIGSNVQSQTDLTNGFFWVLFHEFKFYFLHDLNKNLPSNLDRRTRSNLCNIIGTNLFNPIPAGVLENQDTLGGGGNLTPPSLNPMFDVQIWQNIHHWKVLCSTFRICKKNYKFANIEFFFTKPSYIVKIFAKKIVQKIMKYTFLYAIFKNL